MPTAITRYACNVCGWEHDAEADAVVCEARGLDTVEGDPQVGDLVECGSYGWWSGDPQWVTHNGTEYQYGSYRPRMVVIERRQRKPEHGPLDGHTVELIMYTPSHVNGEDGVYMTSPRHIPARVIGRMTKADVERYRAIVVEQSKQYRPRLA